MTEEGFFKYRIVKSRYRILELIVKEFSIKREKQGILEIIIKNVRLSEFLQQCSEILCVFLNVCYFNIFNQKRI